LKADLLNRAQKVVRWFGVKDRDPKRTARVYFPEYYRGMMRVFRQACFTFTEDDVTRWEELIRILTAQERATRKQK
jgi:hypothetical protein